MTNTKAKKGVEEALELFGKIAEIQRLIDRVDQNGPYSQCERICQLIESTTHDVRWRDAIITTFGGEEKLGDDEWAISSLNSFTARLAEASEAEDNITKGNIYLKCGMYDDAYRAYMASSHPEILVSHLHISQRNWTYVTGAFSNKLAAKSHVDNAVALNLAVAYWNLDDYSNCLAALLSLGLNEKENKKIESIWLSQEEVRTMLLLCSLICFNSDLLAVFANEDRLAEYFELVDIIHAYAYANVERFWDLYDEQQFKLPAIGDNKNPLDTVKDRLHQNWLFPYNKLPVNKAIHIFSRRQPSYSIINLIDDLTRWEAPYKVDLTRGHLEYFELPYSSSQAAESLARDFQRDALTLLWSRYSTS